MYDTLLKVTKHNQPEKTLAYNFFNFRRRFTSQGTFIWLKKVTNSTNIVRKSLFTGRNCLKVAIDKKLFIFYKTNI